MPKMAIFEADNNDDHPIVVNRPKRLLLVENATSFDGSFKFFPMSGLAKEVSRLSRIPNDQSSSVKSSLLVLGFYYPLVI